MLETTLVKFIHGRGGGGTRYHIAVTAIVCMQLTEKIAYGHLMDGFSNKTNI